MSTAKTQDIIEKNVPKLLRKKDAVSNVVIQATSPVTVFVRKGMTRPRANESMSLVIPLALRLHAAPIVLVDTPISDDDDAPSFVIDDTDLGLDDNNGDSDENFLSIVRTNTTAESPFTHGSETSPSRPRRTNAGYNPTLHDFIVPTTTKPCKCGGTDHQKTNSSKCSLNKKNLAKIQDSNSTNANLTVSTINETQTFDVPAASNAMKED